MLSSSLPALSITGFISFRTAIRETLPDDGALKALYGDTTDKVRHELDAFILSLIEYGQHTPENVQMLYASLRSELNRLSCLFNDAHIYAGMLFACAQKNPHAVSFLFCLKELNKVSVLEKVSILNNFAKLLTAYFEINEKKPSKDDVLTRLRTISNPESTVQSEENSAGRGRNALAWPRRQSTLELHGWLRQQSSASAHVESMNNELTKCLIEDHQLPPHIYILNDSHQAERRKNENDTQKLEAALHLLLLHEYQHKRVTTAQSACRFCSRIEFDLDDYGMRAVFEAHYRQLNLSAEESLREFRRMALAVIGQLQSVFGKFPVELEFVYDNERRGVKSDSVPRISPLSSRAP